MSIRKALAQTLPDQIVKFGRGIRLRFFIGSLLIGAVILALIFGYTTVQRRIQDLPPEMGAFERIQAENEIWRTPLQVGGALIVFVGLSLTAWRISVSDRQVGVSEQAQLTERFSRAIEHLGRRDEQGNPATEIRLGGIYALERIAHDSPRDHWTIMEVLTAYLHERRPWYNPAGYFLGTEQHPEEYSELIDIDEERSWEPPPADVQAVITVLGRRKHTDLESERLRISRADLANVVFRAGSNFDDVKFDECNLLHVAFTQSTFRNANFDGSLLYGASFSRCDLRGAIFLQAHLRGNLFAFSNLEGLEIRDVQQKLLKSLSEEQKRQIVVVPVSKIEEAINQALTSQDSAETS